MLSQSLPMASNSTMHGLRPSKFDLVLLVAMHDDARAAMVDLLQEDGYGVLAVERAADAAAFLDTAHASLMVVDAAGQEHEVAQLLAQIAAGRGTPSIVLGKRAEGIAGPTTWLDRPSDFADQAKLEPLAAEVANKLRRDRVPSLRPRALG
ncbi:MAG: hypothetical protein NVSMB47_21430 [Polyangiales bacterium]